MLGLNHPFLLKSPASLHDELGPVSQGVFRVRVRVRVRVKGA